jgi:hypothetical protein
MGSRICEQILDPMIDCFGRDRFQLTYGFCSTDLRRYLNQKDPVTGLKNGRTDPSRDQHMAHELNRNGKYYCDRLGAACDFQIVGMESVGDSLCGSTYRLVEWILEQRLSFNSLYYYGAILVPRHFVKTSNPYQLWLATQAKFLGIYRTASANATLAMLRVEMPWLEVRD